MLNQKELKPIYKAELEKVWKDEKMVNYCMKETAFIIEHNGKIYDIEKPSIEKCFSIAVCIISSAVFTPSQ